MPCCAVAAVMSGTSRCAHCATEAANAVCSGCNDSHYCNSVCQRADWAAHKLRCTTCPLARSEWRRISATGLNDFKSAKEIHRFLGKFCYICLVTGIRHSVIEIIIVPVLATSRYSPDSAIPMGSLLANTLVCFKQYSTAAAMEEWIADSEGFAEEVGSCPDISSQKKEELLREHRKLHEMTDESSRLRRALTLSLRPSVQQLICFQAKRDGMDLPACLRYE